MNLRLVDELEHEQPELDGMPPRVVKRCAQCRQWLPVSCFSRSRDAAKALLGELRAECKNCDRLRPPFWPVAS